uniref:Uncharacterized protein n=1 Tax=Cacopsylla melanoneura TaxID=428564 RepID=A0A8D8ZAS9_9HEMI
MLIHIHNLLFARSLHVFCCDFGFLYIVDDLVSCLTSGKLYNNWGDVLGIPGRDSVDLIDFLLCNWNINFLTDIHHYFSEIFIINLRYPINLYISISCVLL